MCIRDSVKNIYAQGLGDDFADVADGLAATQQASDLTGEALERATAAGFNLRDVFDYDVSESARAASAMGTAMKLNSESIWFNPAAASFQDSEFDISVGITGIASKATYTSLPD